jgi:aldehyde dehydrogenase
MTEKLAETASQSRSMFLEEYGHFIDGKWVGGASGKIITQINPATGQSLANIQAGNAEDVENAVSAAARAFPAWSRTHCRQRQAILTEMATRLRARADDFAMMESLNNGKTIMEARHFDIEMAIDLLSYFAAAAGVGIPGETHDYPDAIGFVHREPIGVVAQIIPWNVPLIMATAKLAPALAAGVTVVLKPAETVCLAVLEFIREVADLLPPGVVNIVTGYGADVGEALVTHPLVRKVAFTGSVFTGRKIIEYASRNIIPQTLELGGKSAQIVCPTADIDAAVRGAVESTIVNKGEICLAGSRVFVHDAIREEFVHKFAEALKQVKLGDPTLPETQMGAQASKAQFDKIMAYLDLAASEGATVLTGGERARGGLLDKGYFIKPTLLDNARNDMRVAREEIFGPVTAVIGWSDEADVMRQANDSDYGLGGGIWSRDIGQVHRMARNFQTGTIWVNKYYNLRVGMPLGGYKQSGFGREFSTDILRDYTISKSVILHLEDA